MQLYFLKKKHAKTETLKLQIIRFYNILAWEPSSAKVIKSYSRRLPHLNDFTGKLNFPYKIDPLNLESQNQA